MNTDYIFNLYERLDSMKKTLSQFDEEIGRNEGVINVLQRADLNEKNKLGIDDFIKRIQEQVDSYKTQKDQLKDMIKATEEIIKLYESDKDKYTTILNLCLKSFGFKEGEKK